MARYTVEEPQARFTVEEPYPTQKNYSVEQPVLENIKEHPIKSVFSPLAETLTGKSLQDRALEGSKPKFDNIPNSAQYWGALLKNAGAGMVGSAVDIATTPATYIPIPGAKLLGKIPIKGTTLGEIVKKVPVTKSFLKDVIGLGNKEIKSQAESVISYVKNGQKIYTHLTQDELNNLMEEVKKIPDPVKGEFPIHLDAFTSNLKKIGKQVSREEFIAGHSQAQQVFHNAKTPIQKIISALNEATPLRAEQEQLYTQARAKRAAVLKQIEQSDPSQAGYFKQLSSLKGELPKVTYEGIASKVSQDDINSLYKNIADSSLGIFEKISAKGGLTKLLGQEGVALPTEGELALLKQVFPEEFIQTVLSKRPFIEKFNENLAQVLNIPRAAMSTADLSAPLRQGVFLIGRPKQFLPAFGNMFKYFANEKSYQGLLNDIKSRPTYSLMKEAKLPLTDMEAMTNREEAFMSRFLEKVPLFGSLNRASNRAYSGFLNKLRADVFDDLIKNGESQGVQWTSKSLRDLGNFIGAATGRGTFLNSELERAAPLMNGIFFSPRLMASRLNLMNPVFYTKLDPFVRKEALKSLFTFVGTASTVLGLASAGGAKVGIDPRSSDFGKIKVGNTRYDILGGFQQYIRLASQLKTGEMVSSTTGVKMTLGEGYKPLTRLDILGRFLQTKENPIASFVTEIMQGKTFEGENINLTKEVAERFVPMVLQDMMDLYKEKGIEGIGGGIPAIFGVGVQTYSPSASELVYSAKSIRNYSKKLIREGKIDEGKDFYNDNKHIVDVGNRLSGYQEQINIYERQKEYARKYVGYSEQKKKELIYTYDTKIKEIQTLMEAKAKELLKK